MTNAQALITQLMIKVPILKMFSSVELDPLISALVRAGRGLWRFSHLIISWAFVLGHWSFRHDWSFVILSENPS